MTIADQINDIQTKVDALVAPTVDFTPVLTAIAALKTELDTTTASVAAIEAKLTSTPSV